MGCTTSRIENQPPVTLCHDRCKFLEEALHQSYVLADAHVSYMQSLKALGPALRLFLGQELVGSSHSVSSKIETNPTVAEHNDPSKCSSPDRGCQSSSNSDTHLDFRFDSEEDEEFRDKDLDLQNPVNPNHFHLQTLNSTIHSDFFTSNDDLFRAKSPFATSSTSWKTPSPPNPASSTWDFLNFFDVYERCEIPVSTRGKTDGFDLENRPVDVTSENDKSGGNCQNLVAEKDTNGLKPMPEKVDEKQNEKENEKTGLAQDSKNRSILEEVMRELESCFIRAADSGSEVLKVLDTGKFRYHDRNFVHQGISTKMLQVVSPSSLILSCKMTELFPANEKIGSVNSCLDQNSPAISVNLSTTLKKLCMWEEKLYNEVKAEEKLRIVHTRTCSQLNGWSQKEAESSKFDSAQKLLSTLSTNIRVAIQVIDRISITINDLRDGELWTHINDLILKLLGTWKAMGECHRCQAEAISGAKCLDAIASDWKLNDTRIEAAMQLKIDLRNWGLSFFNWVTAQRCYVKAFNGWLLKCLPNEPEPEPEDTGHSSPTEPAIFALCNDWSNAIDRVSETEVTQSIQGFLTKVQQFLETQNDYVQQRIVSDKDVDRKLKALEREDQRLHKLMQAKNLFAEGMNRSERIKDCNLQFGLQQIFIAIEKFSASSVKMYEELQFHFVESTFL
ncbi:hypothetical protein K2173_027858 [Erythroxylum novogranatense]|uniref:Nitrate regulatory gene2 protein n=1 Tax=Erythroxylum novogranatense TaxID=1862640 RepID=A0AAV8U1J5_9ROSI|nr:hypothetical protein K2173_027858 [Erythroxylum novogranatense]